MQHDNYSTDLHPVMCYEDCLLLTIYLAQQIRRSHKTDTASHSQLIVTWL